MYSTVCHQNFLKSFTYGNVIFLVCARCTGIYFGAWLSSLIALFLSDNLVFKTKFLVFISIPIILDVMLLTFKFYTYNKLLSSFTGLLFGSVVFIYILSGIENLQFTEKHLMNNE